MPGRLRLVGVLRRSRLPGLHGLRDDCDRGYEPNKTARRLRESLFTSTTLELSLEQEPLFPGGSWKARTRHSSCKRIPRTRSSWICNSNETSSVTPSTAFARFTAFRSSRIGTGDRKPRTRSERTGERGARPFVRTEASPRRRPARSAEPQSLLRNSRPQNSASTVTRMNAGPAAAYAPRSGTANITRQKLRRRRRPRRRLRH